MAPKFQPHDSGRFAAALRRFDEGNAQDPNSEIVGGKRRPRELVYAEWLTRWVLRLCPDASEPLRLAARCQHLCRWMLPRDSYPKTRAGYLQWREALKKFHAQKAGEILREVGCDPATIERVQELNLKKGFPQDAEARVLEDALCLVFLEHQFEELAGKMPEDKMLEVVRKTWNKMTPPGRAAALGLSYTVKAKALLERALSEIRDQRSEIRDQRSEIRDQRSEVRDQRLEARVNEQWSLLVRGTDFFSSSILCVFCCLI